MELADRIMAEIRKRGEENIYRFRLKGMRDPDIEFDLSSLEASFALQKLLTIQSRITIFLPCLQSIPVT